MKQSIQVDKTRVFVYRGSACLACVTRDDFLLLARQFREVHGIWTYELPGGSIEDGESELQAALRETGEEIGILVHSAKKLFSLDLDFSASIHRTSVFLANLEQGHDQIDSSSTAVAIRLAEARRMCFDGRISHAPTVAAILAISLNGNDKSNY